MSAKNRESLFKYVNINTEGYYELIPECRKDMRNFYEDSYYQDNMSTYKAMYSDEEKVHRNYVFQEKECAYYKIGGTKGKFMDIGCGEGHALQYFSDKGWNVKGIDFSEYGMLTHHPEMKEFLIKGDLFEKIAEIDETFDFINMDNVLEHLPNPGVFLDCLKSCCTDRTIICIRVPNDFSVTQMSLFELGHIDSAFWVTDQTSEHFNYFNIETLQNFLEKKGYTYLSKYADLPIDFNLYNLRTNYYKDKTVGHDGYVANLQVENMLYAQSIEKTLAFHESVAALGVGRAVSVFVKLKNKGM